MMFNIASTRMKNTFIIVAIILCLVSCGANERYSFAQSSDNIYEMYVVEINHDEETETILTQITEPKSAITQIQGLDCKEYWNDPCITLGGIALKVYYKDGSYEIITSSCNIYCTGEKKNYGREYFNKDDFDAVLLSYCS